MNLGEIKQRIDELIEEYGENQNVFVSMDVSTGEDDFDHRLFGEILEIINHGTYGVGITVELTEDNYDYKYKL